MTLIDKRSDEGFAIRLKLYKSMSESERQAFQQRVIEGGEVTPVGLSRRMERAHILGYAEMGDQPVAVGAVKRTDDSYLEKVFRLADYDLIDCVAELGWVYVAPEARGKQLGSRLSSALCECYKHPIFATTRSVNIPMQAILRKLGFKNVGAEYDAVEHPGERIGLWLRVP